MENFTMKKKILNEIQIKIHKLNSMDCCIKIKPTQVYDKFIRLSDVDKIIRKAIEEIGRAR